jgi:cell division transport system ATP-binding protein
MIRFDDVCKSFRPDAVAIDHVSFTIDSGEFVFLTGHSGSGKTTLLRLLLREYQPDSGNIYFQDQDLSRLSRRKVAHHRRRVGVVFQDCQLLDDLNVAENIALPLIIGKCPRLEIKKRIQELLKLLSLDGYEKVFPVQLSGGEAQRIALARALATAPDIIFADEPTGNLDQDNATDIVNLLQSVNQYGTTVILATHNLSLLSQMPSARLLTLQKGQLAKDTGSSKPPKSKSTSKNKAKSTANSTSPDKNETKEEQS